VEIKNQKNELIRIKSLGYQYPESDDTSYDGNWLNVQAEVISERSRFQIVDPCLLTWELREISAWFADLSTSTFNLSSKLSFIEPNLSFSAVPKSKEFYEITINLSNEFNFYREEKFVLSFSKSVKERNLIASEFLEEYLMYPERR
jgi:hypothetical protein